MFETLQRSLKLTGIVVGSVLVLTGCSGCIDEAAERDARIMKKARAATGGEMTAEKKDSESGCLKSFFTQSLHHTGEGMRYWYEEAGGFMDITGIPYAQLDCKNCHIQSCDKCHVREEGKQKVLSREKARDMKTCMPCHGREGLTFKFDAAKGQTGVHMAADMACADCHFGDDVHGDGQFRQSMRAPGAVAMTCEKCHVDQVRESPAFDPETAAHAAHGDKLACQACHVSNTTACMNCHFNRFLETGQRKGNFIPMKEWLLLINHEGKVTSGSAMTLVYDQKKFIAYVPYYTHSVMPEGRKCDDCHQNKAVQLLEKGEKVPVMAFRDGKVVPWKGVVPVIPDQLDFVYLDKTDAGWVPLSDDTKETVQFAEYGEPLTPDQLRMLAEDVSE
ncbi:hypothetical protein DENIS_4965 [Desulfonema ishimotonii]|uniref:Uncharacterized protein n=1 Tax=Desulfonema ishimotonii TaxID=45657 RepID=A0A401G4B0_9BACT|nr:cytochrome c3 family protein [Desulfonema ishimotonii]GBC63965.1 hypothetical protein DENIS_4965 [Desulfonema ishimotonii]